MQTQYCTQTNGFVGNSSAYNNVAYEYISAVVTGDDNQSCSAGTIAGGEYNVLNAAAADDSSSFIGGGKGNLQLNGGNGFIGNGVSNDDEGTTSFIGDGTSNNVTSAGSEAFIGGGDNNENESTAGAIVAGSTNRSSDEYSFVGGGTSNAAIADEASIVGGKRNLANASEAFVGGGYANTAEAQTAFIGAGEFNNNQGQSAFIGAGSSNTISTGDTGAFIGAGSGDRVAATNSAVVSGLDNTALATGSFVGDGSNNSISSAGSYASIVGGYKNAVSAEYASILGGYGNTASASYATVAGGDADTAAGTLSFAAGYHADAVHNGSFVWSDYSSGSAVVKDAAANQFVVRASGGTTVYSNEGATSGVSLAAGSGTWASLSDRNAKTGIVPLDDASILAKVSALPVSVWRYKTESGVRHVGPMAQDFYAAFGLGEDNRHITSIDEDGVALAAIKALHRENAELRARLATLEVRNAVSQDALLRANERLERRLDRLAARMHV